MPRLLIIGGPGSGKTTLSVRLARSLSLVPVELDRIGYEGGAGPRRPLTTKLADVEKLAAGGDWIAEGIFLGWTESLFQRATAIVWLDIPWRVAAWRIVTRHARKSLRGTNRHGGLRNLSAFLKSARRYYTGPLSTPAALDDDGAITRAFTERTLACYEDTLIRCRSNADVERVAARFEREGEQTMNPLVSSERVIPDWGRGPGSPDLGLISTVATDSNGTVFVLCRTPRAVMHRFQPDGRFIGSWDYPFVQPHGLWIGPDDRVFTTDAGDHTVRIFTAAGQLLQTIGTPGIAGSAGAPFNAPTRAVAGPSGDIYVTDGYGQNRVHRFHADGRLVLSWGGDGTNPGEFETPHSLWVDSQERVYVVDRGNGRVQIFDNDGNVLDIWDGLVWPHDIFFTNEGIAVVTNCSPRSNDPRPYYELMPSQPICLFSLTDRAQSTIGTAGPSAGEFLDCPHSVWVDPNGDVYVSEVVTPNRLQKFRAAERP
jgi:adenylate kinase family enzyme/sugar lactone lactonase YvrE